MTNETGNDTTAEMLTAGPPWIRFIAVATVLTFVGASAWYQRHGWEDVLAFGLGVAFGSVLAIVGRKIMKRQLAAEGYAIVSSMLLGSFFGIATFFIGILVVAFVWKNAVLPASSAALFLYLGAKFFDLWWTQKALSASGESK